MSDEVAVPYLYQRVFLRVCGIQATVVHDVNAIDAKSVSLAHRVTIADEAMAQFRHSVSDHSKH